MTWGPDSPSTALVLGQLVLIFTQLLSDLVVSSGGDAVSGSKGPSACELRA